MGRAELIRGSLRAHAMAWLGLVPVLGIPFVIGAILEVTRCERLERDQWNPAERYYRRASVLSAIAVLLQFGAFAWLVHMIANWDLGE